MHRTLYILTGIALAAGCTSQTPTEVPSRAVGTCPPLLSPPLTGGHISAQIVCVPGQVAGGAGETGGAAQSGAQGDHRSALLQELATLRRVTAPFHDIDAAAAAGWSTKITACMVDPAGTGGMGFHYGNTGFIDGSVQVDQPELLLYEPEQNGRLSLVAVEYIIPYTAHSRDAAAPVLLGQKFQQNDTFQLWGLHVWVWKENPNGLFANWNPRVTCDHTQDIAQMVH